MNNDLNPKGKSAVITLIWLMVGLAPIPILLLLASASAQVQESVGLALFFLCVVFNLIGAFGCVRNVEGGASRIIFGLFLAAGFFVLSVVAAVFEACSNTHV
jgi:hypothetical protein